MIVLKALSKCLETVIVALNTLGNDDEKSVYAPAKSSLLKEEQRPKMGKTFYLNNKSFAHVNRWSRYSGGY